MEESPLTPQAIEQLTHFIKAKDVHPDVFLMPGDRGYRGETRALAKLLAEGGLKVERDTEQQFYETYSDEWIAPTIYVLQHAAVPIILSVIANYLSEKFLRPGKATVHMIVKRADGEHRMFNYSGPSDAIGAFTGAVSAAITGNSNGEEEEKQGQGQEEEGPGQQQEQEG